MVIGEFTISDGLTTGKVWIRSSTGEGGDFCEADFMDVVKQATSKGNLHEAVYNFFWDNF